jgi:hypothetical protein
MYGGDPGTIGSCPRCEGEPEIPDYAHFVVGIALGFSLGVVVGIWVIEFFK